MERSSTIFLQGATLLIGAGALVFLLWEPHLEGRNAHATLFQIYFDDPFLAYAYVASIPFFVALHRVFQLLGCAGQNRPFLRATADALRTVRNCAMATIGFVAVGEVFIVLDTSDDRAGGVFMGLLITFGSIVVAIVAAMFERRCRKALDAKPVSGPAEQRDPQGRP